jgi:amino acid transporter
VKTHEKVGAKTLSTFLLAMMTLGLIVGIPVAAELAKDGPIGITIILFGFFAAFIPSWLVCSELATMYPHDGGVYLWVKEAFGPKAGFQAIWMQWTDQIVFLTASLAVAGASLTFLFDAESTLADNRVYLGVVIILVIWLATGANMFGVRGSGRIATAGVLMATIIPALVVIFMGIDFFLSGGTLRLETDGGSAFVPTGADLSLILPGYTAFLALEVTAVFVRRMRNPRSQYPKALLIAGLTSMVLLIGVALVIMSALPSDEISSEAGIMATIQALADQTRLGFLIPITAVCITLGWVGLASNIFIGPATGLLATARYGHLPKSLTRENRHGAPFTLLVSQAIIATVVALGFLSFSDTQVAFAFVVTLATMIYALMYILMYAAAIRLRRTKPDVKRPFYALGKNPLWITILCIWAILMAFAIIVNGFFAPSTLPPEDAARFPIVICIAFIVFAALPLIVDRGGRATVPEDLSNVEVDMEAGEIFLDETSVLPVIRPKKDDQ